jgi:hypothetical protein
MIDLNNGGLSPSLRIVTKVFVPAGSRQSLDKKGSSL